MNVAVACPSCRRKVSSDSQGRLPPWCKHCGADLKAEERTSTSNTPDAAEQPDGLEAPVSVREVPFINCCIPSTSSVDNTLYRLYVTDEDVIVIKVGQWIVEEGEFQPERKLSYMMPASHGARAVAIMLENQRKRFAENLELLSDADEASLRRYASEWKGCFTMRPEQLSWLRIEPPSRWKRFLCSMKHEAMLKFAHVEQGKFALAILSVKDVRRAVEMLPQLFPGSMEISLPWTDTAGEGR